MGDETFYRWRRTKNSDLEKQTQKHSWNYAPDGKCVGYTWEVSKHVKKVNWTFDDSVLKGCPFLTSDGRVTAPGPFVVPELPTIYSATSGDWPSDRATAFTSSEPDASDPPPKTPENSAATTTSESSEDVRISRRQQKRVASANSRFIPEFAVRVETKDIGTDTSDLIHDVRKHDIDAAKDWIKSCDTWARPEPSLSCDLFESCEEQSSKREDTKDLKSEEEYHNASHSEGREQIDSWSANSAPPAGSSDKTEAEPMSADSCSESCSLSSKSLDLIIGKNASIVLLTSSTKNKDDEGTNQPGRSSSPICLRPLFSSGVTSDTSTKARLDSSQSSERRRYIAICEPESNGELSSLNLYTIFGGQSSEKSLQEKEMEERHVDSEGTRSDTQRSIPNVHSEKTAPEVSSWRVVYADEPIESLLRSSDINSASVETPDSTVAVEWSKLLRNIGKKKAEIIQGVRVKGRRKKKTSTKTKIRQSKQKHRKKPSRFSIPWKRY